MKFFAWCFVVSWDMASNAFAVCLLGKIRVSFQVSLEDYLIVIVIFSNEWCFARTHEDDFYFAINEQ